MSILDVQIGCGDRTCEARIVAWVFDPDDAGRAEPCPACVAAVELMRRHWHEDRDRTLRSASNVIAGRW